MKAIHLEREPGVSVVIITSGTHKAALHASTSDGTRLHLHLFIRLPDGLWIVELRQPENGRRMRPVHAGFAEELKRLEET